MNRREWEYRNQNYFDSQDLKILRAFISKILDNHNNLNKCELGSSNLQVKLILLYTGKKLRIIIGSN